MSTWLIETLLHRSPRERRLLALIAGLGLPMLIAGLVLLPLVEQRTAAREAYAEARAERAWVTARIAEQDHLRAGPQDSGPQPPIGVSGLEQSLIAADLRGAVTRLANAADGGIALGFDRVVFTDLMDWISAANRTWGYDIETLRLQRGEEPGLVAADLALTPQNRVSQ